MGDRGIPFSGPMVRALLDGRKTQTRRLIATQPPEHVTSAGSYSNSTEGPTNRWSWLSGDPRDCDTWGWEGDFKVRHTIGDRLYVREHWRTWKDYDHLPPSEMLGGEPVFLEADRDNCERHGRHRQAMHMPRWASRLTLLVTDVRVQRLGDMTEADAMAEGIYAVGGRDGWTADGESWFASPKIAFHNLWDSLHTTPGTRWEDNPWIYADTFDVRRGNIDNLEGAS